MTIGRTVASAGGSPGRLPTNGLKQKASFYPNGPAGRISQPQVACELLNKLPYGVVCVDDKLHIEFMNDTAHVLLGQDDGLKICDNRLVAETPKQTAQIQALVKCAAQGAVAGGASGVWTTRIPRRSIRRSFEVVAALLPQSAERESTAAALFIFDPDGEVSPDAEMIARLYGLTGAEVRVAVMLMQGKTLQQTSIVLQRTKETVRKQLQSIFDKTNTNRQSELISLLLRGPAALRF